MVLVTARPLSPVGIGEVTDIFLNGSMHQILTLAYRQCSHNRPTWTFVALASAHTGRLAICRDPDITEREIERLIEAASKHGRYGHRDATAILIAFRHGLRAFRG